MFRKEHRLTLLGMYLMARALALDSRILMRPIRRLNWITGRWRHSSGSWSASCLSTVSSLTFESDEAADAALQLIGTQLACGFCVSMH